MDNVNTSAAAAVIRLEETRPNEMSILKRARLSMLKARWPLVALVLLLIILFLAVFGPAIAPRDPNRQDLILRLLPPMSTDRTGEITYVLGTDGMGRDLLSRVIYGTRISIAVGFVAVAVGGILGTTLGMLAGYFGGPLDDIIMRLADIQLAFPFILLTIMMLVVLGPGVANLVLVLGISQWVTYARIARGQTMAQREREYVEAARCLGTPRGRIIFRQILPNILAPIIVIASFNVASVILAEASLSFLGLGVPPTIPTWGGILAESRDQLLGGYWWLAVYPGLAIMLTVLSLNILGDWLRDFLDPRLRGRE
ncbi:MAG TPA: ABC transporter permease [Aggregatilineales bacterium]|nr:ABC transporter permease [Aggregatilineales bacterium]